MKIQQSCVENKQSAVGSISSLSEGSFGLSRVSPTVSSPPTSLPSRRYFLTLGEFDLGDLYSATCLHVCISCFR